MPMCALLRTSRCSHQLLGQQNFKLADAAQLGAIQQFGVEHVIAKHARSSGGLCSRVHGRAALSAAPAVPASSSSSGGRHGCTRRAAGMVRVSIFKHQQLLGCRQVRLKASHPASALRTVHSCTSSSMQGLYHHRHQINTQLDQRGLKGEVQVLVRQLAGSGHVDRDSILHTLQQRGTLSKLIQSVAPAMQWTASRQHPHGSRAAGPPAAVGLSQPGRVRGQYLHVRVKGAKALTEYLARSALPGEQLSLSMQVHGERATCSPVPACVEPHLAAELLVALPGMQLKGGAAGSKGPPALLALREPLHIVVLQSLPLQLPPGIPAVPQGAHGDTATEAAVARLGQQHAVLGTATVDWRKALCRQRGAYTLLAELKAPPGTGDEIGAAASVGVLELQLRLHPAPSQAVEKAVVGLQQRAEQRKDAEQLGAFVQRARMCWTAYVTAAPGFRHRLVKILAKAQDGTQHPVGAFVNPLQLGRLLASPHEAARFVSLLRVREDISTLPGDALGAGTAGRCWYSLHTVLASRSASMEEMALLLCSLLLGFGLDAWVCCGQLRDGSSHMWVLTRSAEGGCTFWEASSGIRYGALDVDTCPYAAISCVFNHRILYANAQEDDAMAGCCFDFEDGALWLDMGGVQWPSLVLGPPSSLAPLHADVAAIERCLEGQLMQMIGQYRAAAPKAQHTSWEAQLTHLLMPALALYEQEALSGIVDPSGAEDFQTAIRRYVPMGYVFKGVPQHHRTLHAGAIVAALLEEPVAADMLATHVPDMAFALRVRVRAYAEGVVSVWLMLALKYKRSEVEQGHGSAHAGQGADGDENDQ